jgi:hypothetical protein
MIKDEVQKSERWHHGWCYCGLWEKSPETLEKQGVPKGYCGMCIVCGKPGHTMHFPGSAPFTGAWCKFHYYRVMIFHPAGSIGVFVWGTLFIGTIIAIVRWFGH